MKTRYLSAALCAAALAFFAAAPQRASAAAPYAAFTAGAQVKRGLFPIWQKGGHTYLELAPGQLDKDFLETIVPGNGVAQQPVWWGDTDYLPTELVRFERRGDKIVILWPNWYARAPGNASAQLANQFNFPDSVVGTGDIAAEDASTGNLLFDVSSLIGDELDLRNIIDGSLAPDKAYRLDPSLSYVDAVKAFPQNDVITVSQTWSTEAAHVIDTAPDARKLRINVVYNFVQMPQDDYRPRYADDRLGIYDDVYLDFANDRRGERLLRYLVRWNFDPADPSRPSKARHPMVIYLSKSVPPQYRPAITDACLEWNKALARAGILDGVQVRLQPDDPNWDPDDFRYSVIRWLDEAQPAFGADSQTLFNPLTGEEIRTGVIVSAGVGFNAMNTWKYVVDPIRYGRNTDPVPAKFVHDEVFSTLLHEMGHNMGLQHNFIGSMAYTARQLQDASFTRRNGVTSSAMEYAPINLWPRGTPQGDFYQTTLGPYDYFAIKYGYQPLARAATPEAERPTLAHWAAAWSNPLYRYMSDEDVSWNNGHAADPRSEQGDLTNDPMSWCETQMRMYRGQMDTINRLWPQPGHDYEEESRVFGTMLRSYLSCPNIVSHFIGGQYLSRAHRGDPGAQPAVVPVSRADEHRAFAILDRYLFDSRALEVAPQTLARLGYSEWAGYGYTGWEGYGNLPLWAYNPPVRHDYALADRIRRVQLGVVDFLLQPVVLARIDENPSEATRRTMSITDLFDWLHQGVFGGLDRPDVPLISRNLQLAVAGRLETLMNKPAAGTPPDAQGMARVELQRIARDAQRALRHPHDAITSAHLQNLIHAANGSLGAIQTR
ncbi:MAG: zinc-dependent metalloprotease [Candidatus Baltobacteraceae bacterium]